MLAEYRNQFLSMVFNLYAIWTFYHYSHNRLSAGWAQQHATMFAKLTFYRSHRFLNPCALQVNGTAQGHIQLHLRIFFHPRLEVV